MLQLAGDGRQAVLVYRSQAAPREVERGSRLPGVVGELGGGDIPRHPLLPPMAELHPSCISASEKQGGAETNAVPKLPPAPWMPRPLPPGAHGTLQPSCGTLTLRPLLAPLGSQLTASCSLLPGCLGGSSPHPGDLIWRLNGETRQLMLQPGDPRGNGTLTATAVLTAEQPRGELGCYLPRRGGLHLLGMAAFQAGGECGLVWMGEP